MTELTTDEKIKIMEMATFVNATTASLSKDTFEDRYKKMVDLICNYNPKNDQPMDCK